MSKLLWKITEIYPVYPTPRREMNQGYSTYNSNQCSREVASEEDKLIENGIKKELKTYERLQFSVIRVMD
jgi:hypothetical protein